MKMKLPKASNGIKFVWKPPVPSDLFYNKEGEYLTYVEKKEPKLMQRQIFHDSGIWKRPEGVTEVRVLLIGSGGAGSHEGYGGGAGSAISIKTGVDSDVEVVVGKGTLGWGQDTIFGKLKVSGGKFNGIFPGAVAGHDGVCIVEWEGK